MFGLTPMKDLRREAVKEFEEDMSLSELSSSGLSKVKKIKLSLKNEKVLRKHATYEQVETLRLRKNKRLLIMQLKKLRQQLYELGEETGLIERGNTELREISFAELTKVVGSVMEQLEKKKKEIEELTENANHQQETADKAIEKVTEKFEHLNLVEKRQHLQNKKNKKDKKFIKKQREMIKKTKIMINEQKKKQKSNLELSEINFKASIERVKEVDIIYDDIERDRKLVKQAGLRLSADRKSLEKKQEQLKIREIAVKDREQSVRRLIQEARKAGVVM